MQRDETDEMEVTLEEARKLVERRDMLTRLRAVPEFRALIEDLYFKDTPVRVTSALADPSMERQRPNLLRSLDGISELQLFFRGIIQMGNAAENEIKSIRETLDEIEAEKADASEEYN